MRAAILALTLFCANQALAQQACLRAGQDGSVVTGRLEVAQYSDASGRRASALILAVAPPVCLSGPDPEDNVQPTARVHVFSSDEGLHKKLQNAVGQILRLKGGAFPAHTVHHRAPVVFNVSAVETP